MTPGILWRSCGPSLTSSRRRFGLKSRWMSSSQRARATLTPMVSRGKRPSAARSLCATPPPWGLRRLPTALAPVASAAVHPPQRGFMRGRQLAYNAVELGGCARLATCKAVADDTPLLVTFGFAAAFPPSRACRTLRSA